MGGAAAFAKFWHIRRAINLFSTQRFRPLGLGPKQAMVMYLLARLGKISQAELSCITGSDPAAIGRSLEHLRRQKLIQQRDHPSDRRRWDIILAPQGRILAAKVAAIFQDMEKHFTGPLSAAESATLVRLLDKILASFARSSQPAGHSTTPRPSARAWDAS